MRTSDLRAAHGWDEQLETNQDFDLNRRLATRGTVWFERSLCVGYLPRDVRRPLEPVPPVRPMEGAVLASPGRAAERAPVRAPGSAGGGRGRLRRRVASQPCWRRRHAPCRPRWIGCFRSQPTCVALGAARRSGCIPRERWGVVVRGDDRTAGVYMRSSGEPTLLIVSRSMPPDTGGYQRQLQVLGPHLRTSFVKATWIGAVRERARSFDPIPGIDRAVRVRVDRMPSSSRGLADWAVLVLALAAAAWHRVRRRDVRVLLLSPTISGGAVAVRALRWLGVPGRCPICDRRRPHPARRRIGGLVAERASCGAVSRAGHGTDSLPCLARPERGRRSVSPSGKR